MTDLADAPPLRHAAVYRTVRGLALSGSRALPAAARPGGNPVLAAPLRVSAVLRVRPASELATPAVAAPDDAAEHGEPDGLFEVAGQHDAASHDDAAGGYDGRRYSEPND
jgi:hypothetical protein